MQCAILCHNTEDLNLNIHCCENFKSGICFVSIINLTFHIIFNDKFMEF
jgi:hypothetical protein